MSTTPLSNSTAPAGQQIQSRPSEKCRICDVIFYISLLNQLYQDVGEFKDNSEMQKLYTYVDPYSSRMVQVEDVPEDLSSVFKSLEKYTNKLSNLKIITSNVELKHDLHVSSSIESLVNLKNLTIKFALFLGPTKDTPNGVFFCSEITKLPLETIKLRNFNAKNIETTKIIPTLKKILVFKGKTDSNTLANYIKEHPQDSHPRETLCYTNLLEN